MTTKNIRRFAAAVTALLLLAALAPIVSAEYDQYSDSVVAYINPDSSEGFSGITQSQANNLFIDLMNRMYPVGSIYMSLGIDDVGDIIDHFGGDWEPWGQGKVPVGVNADGIEDVIPDNAAWMTGGSKGTVNAKLEVSMKGLEVGDDPETDITLTDGSVTQALTGASVKYDPVGKIDLAGSQTLPFSHTLTIAANDMPVHNHPVTVSVSQQPFNLGSESKRDFFDTGLTANCNNTCTGLPFTLTVGNSSQLGTAGPFSSQMTTNLDLSNKTSFPEPLDSFPVLNFTPPRYDYTAQDTATHDLTVDADGEVIIPLDSTLQPYATCYMYRRKALAELN